MLLSVLMPPYRHLPAPPSLPPTAASISWHIPPRICNSYPDFSAALLLKLLETLCGAGCAQGDLLSGGLRGTFPPRCASSAVSWLRIAVIWSTLHRDIPLWSHARAIVVQHGFSS